MNAEIARKLNEQINKEFYSAYLYLDFANYYTDQDLDGFAAWFRIQAQEERDHALLILDYLHDNDERVTLDAIEAPRYECTSPEQPLLLGLQHEQLVTASIHAIYAAAMENKDFRTMQFLNWFIREQREEEKTIRDLHKRYLLFGTEQKGLYLLNSEMGARVYTPAAPQAE